MPKPGREAATDEVAIALGLLRIGSDTRGPRLFRSLVDEPWMPTPFHVAAPPAPRPPTVSHLYELARLLGLKDDERVQAIDRVRQQARAALATAARSNLTTVSYHHESYPRLLWQIPDPPFTLWVKGDPSILASPSVAVVGSRNATPAGLAAARKLGREIAEAGLTVVSGLARGIDAAAHTGALDAGGRTIAVMGCGADVVYPSGHRALAGSVAGAGAS